MSTDFPDHFSGHADQYAAARPTYPDELFDYLAEISPQKECAWDCATGSGQAAIPLAMRFEKVFATDASARQISHATQAENIHYSTAVAENCGLDAHSVDLVTVAQALHWFDFDHFYSEIKRVTKPDGIFAAWTYGHSLASPQIDAIVREFYHGAIASFWPAERSHVESEYRDIPFPYVEIDSPAFEMSTDWSVKAMLDYLRTWSAVKRYQEANDFDPVTALVDPIKKHWGSGIRTVRWSLSLKVGRITP